MSEKKTNLFNFSIFYNREFELFPSENITSRIIGHFVFRFHIL